MKPEDLDERAPVEPDDALLAIVHTRSRSFRRRRRNTQRLTSVTAGFLVVALAGGIAWTRADTDGRRANPTPLATTTTIPAASVLTETEIAGPWKPVSIAGYAGSLAEPQLAFDGDGGWSGYDGCNSYRDGTYRLEGNTMRIVGGALTQAECARYRGTNPDPVHPDFRPVVSAARIELHGEQLIFLVADGTEVARFERAVVTARIELPATSMTAGSTMNGQVVVNNDTGGVIQASGCHGLFQVALGNDTFHPSLIWTTCLQPLPIPVGESRYPVTIAATYIGCASREGSAEYEPCPPGGGMPPLPPGKYEVQFFQSSPAVVPAAPIEITVEPRPAP